MKKKGTNEKKKVTRWKKKKDTNEKIEKSYEWKVRKKLRMKE